MIERPPSEGNSARPAIEFLFGRLNYERTPTVPYQERHFKLERMFELAERLGNPHQQLNIVHVAGSKGKGSTATMISAMLKAAGRSTGLYTSPHVSGPEERISVNLQPCSVDEFDHLIEVIRPHVLAMDEQVRNDPGLRGPTYFEILTAAAFLHFNIQQVDVAVIEVGLGGRLDSTNICLPVCSVITTISKDHTRQLGDTLAAIAGEKAGIIKPRVPLVCGVTAEEARSVIHARADELESELFQRDRDFGFETDDSHPITTRQSVFSYFEFHSSGDRTAPFRIDDLKTGMLGAHQFANATVAIRAVRELRSIGIEPAAEQIRTGLLEARCPARIEVVRQQPPVVVDASHNSASAKALTETLTDHWPDHQLTFVLAATRGKDVESILEHLLPHANRIVFTRYLENPRCYDPRKLQELAGTIATRLGLAGIAMLVEPIPLSAWEAAIRQTANEQAVVCVTGSFFLAAELRNIIMENPGNPT